MPEGPECRIMAEELARLISYNELTSISILSGRYLKKPPTGIEKIEKELPLKIIGAGCHGKFIYWLCHNENFIWTTMGMTGHWSTEPRKHSRIKFSFADGKAVYFNDQRNFGTIKFVCGKQNMIDKLESMGPDMLSDDVSDEEFIINLRMKNTKTLAEVLMNQSVIAGVGNYIKADALWMACMSPHRKVMDCNDAELANIHRCIKTVINENYKSAKSGDFKNIYKNQGYNRKFLVYNQSNDPNGNKVIRETTKDKRTTHWVPEIQK
jgi:DNA-formamidopyrimidine glycosylase